MAARKERHPGKLAHTMKRMAKSIFSGEKEVSDAIRQDVKVGEKAAADSAKAAAKVGTEVAAAGAKLAAADKVKVGFYMESMCPGCKYFTTKVRSRRALPPPCTPKPCHAVMQSMDGSG